MANELTSKAWCDLVFDEKNKEYGAYKLRSGLAHRNLVALIITIIIAAMVVLLPLLMSLMPEPEVKDEEIQVTELATLEEAEVKDESLVKKVDLAPPPPPLKSSVKFVAPVIKKDSEVRDEDEMKSQEELQETKVTISIADVKGNDEEHGKDIAEIKQVVTQAPVEEVEEKPYTAVEQMPQFPGGEAELLKYIFDKLRYPTISQENGVQGKVYIRFVVSKTGEVKDAQVMRSLDPYCDKEALRVIRTLPRWIPGKQNGVNVPVYYVVPITFKLQ